MISNLSQESSITVFVKPVNKLPCYILTSDGKLAANAVHTTVISLKCIKSGAVSVTVIIIADL
jgi:N-methylhydantoinase B/oxoprolinase/acetone carboxylase alpha subunit